MRELSTPILDAVTDLRHELHRRPELSGEEMKTAQIIRRWFSGLHPDETVEDLGGYGVAFVFKGERAGKTLLFRCELDGLPIPEENSSAYKSSNPGVSHTCGHDGHMSILAAVGALLREQRPASGRVILLFQPAEETGEGSSRVLADSKFQALVPDFVFALHNIPKYAHGEVLIREGTFQCASAGLAVKLSGKTSHAAYPENGATPAFAIGELIRELSQLPSTRELRNRYSLVTITYVKVGEISFGVAPGNAELMATLRAEHDSDLELAMNLAEKLVRSKAAEHGLQSQVFRQETFRATAADSKACQLIQRVSSQLGYPVTKLPEPIRWSEDFAEFTARYPGAMFGLGSGLQQPQLHNPDFDFPDQLIPIGARIFAGIIDEVLG